MRIEGGTKLGGRVREGRWLGIDLESKGVWIYWPDNKKVNVERNIYFDKTSVNHLKDENDQVALTRTNPPIVQIPAIQTPVIPEETADESDTNASSKRTRKPSQKVADLLGGKAPGQWIKPGQS